MSMRTIEYAAANGITISESEIGLLFIRYSDIQPLRALMNAAQQVELAMHREMERLRRDLRVRAEERVDQIRIGALVEVRNPIRRVTHRHKTCESLFKKLIEKEQEMDHQPGEWSAVLDNLHLQIRNLGPFSERQGQAGGRASVHWKADDWARPAAGVELTATVYAEGHLGTSGDPSQVLYNRENGGIGLQRSIIHARTRPMAERNKSLLWRIGNLYEIDDLAGIRLECDYISDIDLVLDALRACYGPPPSGPPTSRPSGQIVIAKIDEALSVAKPGGYRGIHVTVLVPLNDLIHEKDWDLLSQSLEGEGQDGELTLPCEIQIRTGYEQSWSEKSHDLIYKRERDIPPQLYESIRLLADQLYQADELSDIVSSGIEVSFVPEDGAERALLHHLRRKLTLEGFAFVEFGLQCAKKRHKADLRYGGRPHFSHTLDILQRVVFRFGILNPELLFLIALHDLWKGRDRKKAESTKDIRVQFIEAVTDEFGDVIAAIGYRLNLDQIWGHELTDESWFWRLLWVLYDSPDEEGGDNGVEESLRASRERRIHRLSDRDRNPERDEKVGDSGLITLDERTREFGLILEAALMLGRLNDLPDDLIPERREKEFEENHRQFVLIRHGLPRSAVKSSFVREAEGTFIRVSRQIGVTVPMGEID